MRPITGRCLFAVGMLVLSCAKAPGAIAPPGDQPDAGATDNGDAGLVDAGPVDAGPPHARPPTAGPAHPADGTGSTTFAVTRYFLGTTLRDGTPSADAWKSFGYDLDGLLSTAASTDLCAPADGAPAASVYPDGLDGTDNSVGKSVFPIFNNLSPGLEGAVNDVIANGLRTLLIDVPGLGSGSDYNPLTVRVYQGEALGAPPAFDGSDVWPVSKATLTDPADLLSTRSSFGSSFLVGGELVASPAGELTVVLGQSPRMLRLALHHAVLTMKLSADHQSAQGTIAGILTTADFVQEVRDELRYVNGGTMCAGGPMVDSVAMQVTQASDILADGTQDPRQTCSGISIGIGFDARVVKLGAIVDEPVRPNPCP